MVSRRGDRPDCPEQPHEKIHRQRRREGSQLSLEAFFLPFGWKLSADTRWLKRADLIPWDELDYPTAFQAPKSFGATAVRRQ